MMNKIVTDNFFECTFKCILWLLEVQTEMMILALSISRSIHSLLMSLVCNPKISLPKSKPHCFTVKLVSEVTFGQAVEMNPSELC